MYKYIEARNKLEKYASLEFLNYKRRKSKNYYRKVFIDHAKAIANLVDMVQVNTTQSDYLFNVQKTLDFFKYLGFKRIDTQLFSYKDYTISLYETENNIILLIKDKYGINLYQGPVYSISHVYFILNSLLELNTEELEIYINLLPVSLWEQMKDIIE